MRVSRPLRGEATLPVAALRGFALLTWAGLSAACLQSAQVGVAASGQGASSRGSDEGLGSAEAGQESGEEDVGGVETTVYPPGLLDVGTEPICNAPTPIICDIDSDHPAHALEIGCSSGQDVTVDFEGAPESRKVFAGVLGPGTYPAQRGGRFLILSTGIAEQLLMSPEQLDQEGICIPGSACPSFEHQGHDYSELPAPIDIDPVGAVDCEADPSLVGTGDCSNTLHTQWVEDTCDPDFPCPPANDLSLVRIAATVPSETSGLSYEFAFASMEYPDFYQSGFNDMFVAWLSSEAWTGNISFDHEGNPISVNAGFLDYKDAPNPHDCPDGCTAAQLHGFAAQGHAATRWLSTSIGVQSGEQIELVFALFDMTDGIVDSYVLLDGVRWDCAGIPPTTIPVP